MMRDVEVPIWLLLLLCTFAAVTFTSHFLFPSVRWFFRRQAEGLVARLNERLARPIQPFKLARRTDTINRLIHDPVVAQAVLDHARDTCVPEEVAFETARRYAREIVPGFSAILYFGVATKLAQWLSRNLYRVRVTGEAEAFRQIDPEATVVYVLNHRSNMDYVLVTWLAARQTALAYAVGEWARRWPLRTLIRAMGGYFVRRRNLNPLYRRVLARYVQIAIRNGVTQAVFPEGRLSRDGALQEPKLGILSYIVADYDSMDTRDVVFVPVALNYERILEDRVLVSSENRAHPFRLRWWMILRYLIRHLQLRLLGRYRRFGYAAVSFGAPLSLRHFLASGPRDAPAELGADLMRRIEDVLPVLPVALVCEALLRGGDTVSAIADHLTRRLPDRRDAGHAMPYPARETAMIALRMLEVRRALTIRDDRVTVRDDWIPILRFYARTLPAHVAPDVQ